MRLHRILALPAALAVVAVPAATAIGHGTHGSSRATVLRATLKPVQGDIANYTNMRGRAQLVANKRNAKVSLHLRGMVARTTYTWAVVKGTDPATVCASGTPVTGLTYKRLRSNRSGNANSKAYARRRAFAFDKTATYAVVVYQTGTTQPLLCGVFKGRAKNSHGHAHSHPSHPSHAH